MLYDGQIYDVIWRYKSNDLTSYGHGTKLYIPKYYKLWPYLLAATMSCTYRQILNQRLFFDFQDWNVDWLLFQVSLDIHTSYYARYQQSFYLPKWLWWATSFKCLKYLGCITLTCQRSEQRDLELTKLDNKHHDDIRSKETFACICDSDAAKGSGSLSKDNQRDKVQIFWEGRFEKISLYILMILRSVK